MSILTNLMSAQIRDAKDELNGKALTRPALLVTEGNSLVYAIDVDIGMDKPLRNVPIGKGTRDISYADIGQAVRLRKTASGRYEVSGFSKEQPGTRVSITVTIPELILGDPSGGLGGPPVGLGGIIIVGTPVDNTLSGRLLTYAELSTIGGGYGIAPYGATGIYKGTTLQEIKV